MKNWSTQSPDVFWRIRTSAVVWAFSWTVKSLAGSVLIAFFTLSPTHWIQNGRPHDSWPVVWRKSASINWNGSWAKISAACSTTSTTRPQLNPLPAASNAKSRKSQSCPGPARRGVRGPRGAHGPGPPGRRESGVRSKVHQDCPDVICCIIKQC